MHAICLLHATVKSRPNVSCMRKQLFFVLTNDAVTSTVCKFLKDRTSIFLFQTNL